MQSGTYRGSGFQNREKDSQKDVNKSRSWDTISKYREKLGWLILQKYSNFCEVLDVNPSSIVWNAPTDDLGQLGNSMNENVYLFRVSGTFWQI